MVASCLARWFFWSNGMNICVRGWGSYLTSFSLHFITALSLFLSGNLCDFRFSAFLASLIGFVSCIFLFHYIGAFEDWVHDGVLLLFRNHGNANETSVKVLHSPHIEPSAIICFQLWQIKFEGFIQGSIFPINLMKLFTNFPNRLLFTGVQSFYQESFLFLEKVPQILEA